MRHSILALVGAFVLAGCTPDVQLATTQAYSPEWCQASKAFPRSGTYLYAVAQCHERGVAGFPKDENLIIYYLTEAARWGVVDAGAALAARGQPVPDDDLRRETADRREAARDRQAIANARNAPAPRREQHPSVLFPGGGPNIMPGTSRPPVTRPNPPPPPRTGYSETRENRTTSTKRNCVNNVCRTETTTCVNGQCTTKVTQ